MHCSTTKQCENRTAEISVSGMVMGLWWPWPFQVLYFWQFSSAAIPLVIHSTVGLLNLLMVWFLLITQMYYITLQV